MSWLDAAPFWERFAFGILGGAFVWWSAVDLGVAVFSACGLNDRARSATAAALGYALLGSVVGILGLFHAIYAWSVIGLFALLFCARWALARRVPVELPRAPIERFREMPILDKTASAATAAAWITGAIAAALPSIWWDPLAYHLPIVARALSEHAFVPDPNMLQTTFVLLGEAAAVPAYAVGGSAGAAFATLGAGIVLALLCGQWAERIAAGSGRIATALLSCSALWLWLAPSFYVDIPYALFAIAALAILTWPEETVRLPLALVAGALAGAAAATKYPGLFIVVLCLVATALAARRGEKAKAIFACGAGALVVAGGWYVRTAIVTGDPVFPFLSTHAAGTVGMFAERYVSMTRTWCGGGTSATDALSLPWRLLIGPRAFCGDPGYALDLGAIFVLASLAALRRTAGVLVICFVLTAFWFASSQQLRFLAPAVCLYAIAAAAGTVIAGPRLRAVGQTLLLALCFVGVLVNWIPGRLDASNSVAPAFAYIVGAQSGEDYLSSRLEFYGAVRWIRGNGSGQVAALDDVRDYYFEPSGRWLNPYYQPFAIDWALPSDRRYASLVAAGFKYLVVNANKAYVDRTPTGVDWRTLNRDTSSGALRVVYSRDQVTVFTFGPDRASHR